MKLQSNFTKNNKSLRYGDFFCIEDKTENKADSRTILSQRTEEDEVEKKAGLKFSNKRILNRVVKALFTLLFYTAKDDE